MFAGEVVVVEAVEEADADTEAVDEETTTVDDETTTEVEVDKVEASGVV